MSTPSNPFVGPRSFETGEALYGRDRELRTLMALVISERIVLLHSPSGAGKSSLVKAGLLPKLKEENFNVLPVVRVNIEPPAEHSSTNRYVLSTLISLEEFFPAAERLPMAELAALSINDYLDKRGPEKDGLVIFDQFEEVLTIAPEDREGKTEFFAQLGLALRNKGRWALFSMREDYLGALTAYGRPIPNRLQTRFRLDLLGSDAAMQAIQKPAQAAGVTFTPSAAEKLVDDLRQTQVQLPDGSVEKQPGQYIEPVQLQVVCYRLWENLKQGEQEINEKNLDSIGNVDDSLAEYYAMSISRVTQSSQTPERIIRDWFEHKLISADGIRGQVRMGLDNSDGLPTSEVRKLVDAHIIRAEQRAGQIWLELSHDRMIEPVRENNRKWFDSNLFLFQRQANLWAEKGRGEGMLLRGLELATALEEAKKIELTSDESDFLEACKVLRKRTLRDVSQKRWILVGFVASAILFIVSLYFSVQANMANQSLVFSKQTAEAASTQAIEQKITAYNASTQAIFQQNLAQAASTQAVSQQILAQAASTAAVASANQAATAEAVSNQQKENANLQEKIAQQQKRTAQANSLVAQSLLAQNKLNTSLANLLAVAAFQMEDNSSTRIQLLDSVTNSGRLLLAESTNTGITPTIVIGADNRRLATTNFFSCANDDFYMCSSSGVVKLWNIAGGGKTPYQITQDANSIGLNGPMLDSMAISPDGTTLAVAGCDPQNNNLTICDKEIISFYNPKTQEKLKPEISFSANIANEKTTSLVFSPDGKTLALSVNSSNGFNSSTTTHPTVFVWNVDTLQMNGQFEVTNGIEQMAFTPDNKTLAIASDRGIMLVDLSSVSGTKTPSIQNVQPANKPLVIRSLAFSPDGKYLAEGINDGTIKILDTQALIEIGQPLDLKQLNSAAVSMAFSPDGKILATGRRDGLVVLWDVSSQTKLVGPLFNHIFPVKDNYPVFDLTFSPDGKFLVSSSNELIVWDTDPASWVAKACAIAGRTLTPLELQQYFGSDPTQPVCGG